MDQDNVLEQADGIVERAATEGPQLTTLEGVQWSLRKLALIKGGYRPDDADRMIREAIEEERRRNGGH
jgi:hypothetical protein